MTHGHLDHVGRLPKLVREGFTGHIYATPPTRDIAGIVMENAEQLMGEDARRHARPKLYEIADVQRAMKQMVATDYSRWVRLGDLKFRFRDAGHIFGSAFIEIEEVGGARAVFSGDMGNRDAPFLRPTAQAEAVDAMIVESTYGNPIQEELSPRDRMLEDVLMSTAKQKGVLLIPAFAVERTQAVLY